MTHVNDNDLNNHYYFDNVDSGSDDFSDNNEKSDPTNTEYNPAWAHTTNRMKNIPFTGDNGKLSIPSQTCNQQTIFMLCDSVF